MATHKHTSARCIKWVGFHKFLPVNVSNISGPYAWARSLYDCYWINEGEEAQSPRCIFTSRGDWRPDMGFRWFVNEPVHLIRARFLLWINFINNCFFNCRYSRSSVDPWSWCNSRSWCWLRPAENWHLNICLWSVKFLKGSALGWSGDTHQQVTKMIAQDED